MSASTPSVRFVNSVILRWLVICGTLGGFAVTASAALDNSSGPKELPVEGKWAGVYFDSPIALAIDLSIRATSSPIRRDSAGATTAVVSVTGAFSYSGLHKPDKRFREVRPEGDGLFSGEYDLDTGTLEFRPTTVSTKAGPPIRFGEMRCVVAEGPVEITGTAEKMFGGFPASLILARPAHAKNIQSAMAGVTGFRSVATTPVKLGGPNVDKLRAWVRPATLLGSPRASVSDARLVILTQHPYLFDDDHFARYFGSPFDAMPYRTRNATFRRLLDHVKSETPEDAFLLNAGPLFSTGGGAEFTMCTVLTMRIQKRWYAQTMTRATEVPPTANALSLLDSMAASTSRLEMRFWPEDRKMSGVIATQKTRIADSFLPAAIEAMGSMEPLENAISALKNRRTLLTDLYRFASGEIATMADGRAEILRRAKVENKIAQGPADVANLGQGELAVTNGARYYRSLQEMAAGTNLGSAVEVTTALLEKRRRQDFADAQSSLVKQVDRWRTAEEAAVSINQWIALPSDRTIPEVKRLLDYIGSRKLRSTSEHKEFSMGEIISGLVIAAIVVSAFSDDHPIPPASINRPGDDAITAIRNVNMDIAREMGEKARQAEEERRVAEQKRVWDEEQRRRAEKSAR